jgi:hypothetical protein
VSRYAKRILLLATGFQAVKYLLILTVVPGVSSEFVAFLFVVLFYITMLPEMMIGPHAGPPNWLAIIPRTVVGILWNALLIHLVLLAFHSMKSRRRPTFETSSQDVS